MSVDNIVDAFASSIIIGVMLVVLVYIYSPDIGQVLLGILPGFVEVMIYLLIGALLAAMAFQAAE